MDNTGVKFLPNRLAIPLFLIPKQRIKQNYADQFKNYVTKKIVSYTKSCENEFAESVEDTDVLDTATVVNPPRPVKLYKMRTCKDIQKEITRTIGKVYPWQLPPNRYDADKEPFQRKKGVGGAYWSKIVAPKVLEKRTIKNRFIYYDLPRETERMRKVCHKHKGILISNARERKPSSRNMLFDAALCYRDPKWPSPTTYRTSLKKRPVKKSPPVEEPYEFYRRSVVPVTRNAIHRRNISFEPAPGRYEIRYPKISCCRGNLIYQPELQIFIERQKRLKFRGLPYTKIKSRLYCSPDWCHVQGRGFRYLFKGAKPKQVIEVEDPTNVRKGKEIKVNYLDPRYMYIINNPMRRPISLWFDALSKEPQRIEFNCLRKPVIRKTLRVNKKIVFGSSQGRFKDSPRHANILTVKQLEAIKNKLPLELQLRDHPIMNKSPDEIQSKFQIIPKRYSNVRIVTRLKDFKFSPLPEPQILVTKDDVHFEMDSHNGYYFKIEKPEKYFKAVHDDDSLSSDSSSL